MDIPNLIRSFIFLTAALLIILFPKQIYKMQDKAMTFLIKTFHIRFIHYTKKQTLHSDKIAAVIFLIISIILLIYSINN